MLSTLTLTTLFASICAASAGALTANKPANLIQCTNTTLTWSGGQGPYNVYVFTDCQDDNDAPIASWENVQGTSQQWRVDLVSGDGLFMVVEDATGADDASDEAYVGGDAGAPQKACAAQIASISSVSTAHPTSTTSASGSVPTTMSNGKVVNGVANAAAAPTSSPPVSTGAALGGTPNAAVSLSARPVQIGAGILAAALAAAML